MSRAGGGYVTQCPVHEDRRASLSISKGEKGAVLKCHAGCTVDDIRIALDLNWPDLFDGDGEQRERSVRDDWMPCQIDEKDPCSGHKAAEYRYTDEAGKLLFATCRCSRKRDGCNRPFAQWRPDETAKSGKRWNLQGVRRVIYRLPEVLAAVREGRRIWITEGEKDADLLCSKGEVATSAPMGAGSWLKEYARYFLGAAEVIVVVDCDDPGLKHAGQVYRDISKFAKKIKAVYTPVNEKGADASDHFDYGLGLDDFERAFFEEIEPRPHMVITVEKEHREKPVIFEGFSQSAIERSLVGSMLHFGGSYGLAGADIFQDERLRIAVQAAVRVAARGSAVMPETVAVEIQDAGTGKYATALKFLEKLEQAAFSDTEKPLMAARILRERSMRSGIVHSLRASIDAVRDERRSIGEVLNWIGRLAAQHAEEFSGFDAYCEPVGDVFTEDVVVEVQRENEKKKSNVRELRPVVSEQDIDDALDGAVEVTPTKRGVMRSV